MSHLFHYFEKSFSPDINPLSAERPGSKRRYVPAASPTSAPAYGSATPPCLHITGGGFSVIGTRHLVNQDRCLVDPRRRVFMVADGMGGNRAGDRAAQMAIELLPYHPALIGCEHFDNQSIRREIAQAFLDVNREITMAGNLDSQSYGMGTTAVLALAVRDRLYVASLGDSRAYLFRDGDLHLYTVDHNMAQILVNMGAISREDARTHRWRHMLCKYLGSADLKEGPDVAVIRLEPGDRVVLVTDGVTEVLTRREMVTVLNSHPAGRDAAEALVRAAVSRGTRDDATSVVVGVSHAAAAN